MIFIIYLYTLSGCHRWIGDGLECLEGDNMVWGCLWCTMVWRMLVGEMQWPWGTPKFEDHCIFWIALSQNIGHIFYTRFFMVVNDNQVIWPAYNFYQQFFYWPFIMIYLTLELLWNKHILYKFLFTFLKIEGLVVYNFPNLVLRLIFDRGGTPFVGFFISQYDFGLGGEGFF